LETRPVETPTTAIVHCASEGEYENYPARQFFADSTNHSCIAATLARRSKLNRDFERRDRL
jgi:hypothetical protein